MISFMIGVILLPFALIAALVSIIIMIPIMTMLVYIPWFIAIHGWTEFKIKYMDDNDNSKGNNKSESKIKQGSTQ